MTTSDNQNAADHSTNQPFLEIDRPIIFLDVQTTGPDSRTARIVRLATLRVEPDGQERFRSQLINPMAPISPGATEFHGITDEDVADCKPFGVYAKALYEYLDGCDLAGFGIRRFHLKVLRQEFEFAGIDFHLSNRTIVDAMEVFHRLEPRDFDSAHRRFVGGEFNRLSSDHATVNAVRAIIAGQINQHPELPSEPARLEEWATGASSEQHIDDQGRFTLSDDGDPIINFGRYRGFTLYDMSENHADYLRWIASDESFTPQQRQIAADAAEGIMPDFD